MRLKKNIRIKSTKFVRKNIANSEVFRNKILKPLLALARIF